MTETLLLGLTITVVGLVIVFLVQGSITLFVGLIRRLDARWQQCEEADREAALIRDPSVDRTTLVLIAAAAATMIAGRHRVRSVRRLLPVDSPQSPWSAQGRAVLQGSHIPGRRR